MSRINTHIDIVTEIRLQKSIFLIISILMIMFLPVKAQSIISADYYFDALNGNDNNSGTSPLAAWKSVNKFNSTNFSAGSIIAFRDSMDYIGGWTINESGTSGNSIKITNWYGAFSEKYPRFINSLILTGWTQTAGYNNIWQASATVGSGISAVYFDCGDSLRWGIHRTSLSELTSEFSIYYTGGQIYVYSSTNPSNAYNQVRYGNIGTSGVPATSHGIYINGSSYITIQYIDAAMNTYNGIRTNGSCSNIKVYDCKMYYNGRGTNDNGNGIELVNVTNVEVKRCTVYENSSHGPYVYGLNGTVSSNIIFDSCVVYNNHHTVGFDLNGNGGIVSNITYRNNIIFETDWYPYRIQNPADYSPANFIAAQGGWQQAYNVYYYNNLIYIRSGNGFQMESEVDSVYIYNNTFAVIGSFNQFCVPLYRGGGDDARVEIRNNIFYTTRSYRACDSRGGANIIKSNNLYYRTDGATGQNDLTYIAFGPGDITGNPLFSNLSLRDFTLQSGSPAIDAGTTLVSPYNFDLIGTVRPQGNGYDIGAYEYTDGSIIDNIPPQVVNASLTSSVTLVINFSEQLNNTTAQNPNNYSVSNGISVASAVLSGTQVTLTTSAHINGAYTVTVNNVIDLAGNIIDPNNNTASYNYSTGDITPPQLINAQILDSITVELEFSELMDETSVENPANYIVTNGINILNAVMTGNQIRLLTSEHSDGIYQVIVNNVTDIAGNVISSEHNSVTYEYQSGSGDNLIQLPVSAVLASVTPEPNHYAEKTIDGKGYYQGDPDSRWAGDTMPEWLVYDLGDVQILNKTKLSFFYWNAGRVYNYSLQVSTDSISWNELRTNIQSASGEWSIEEIGPVEARYVKIIFVANNQGSWAGLWEAEFWGNLVIPTNDEDEKIIPSEFSLEQNYPNPFNPSTKIKVNLTQNTQIRLAVYNMLGELIVEIANGEFAAGTHEFYFDGSGLTSGVYLYRVESQIFTETKKMVLLK